MKLHERGAFPPVSEQQQAIFDQGGRASIKNVLPVLTDASYSDLSINEGMAASLAFVEMVFDSETTDERKAEIRKDLLEYCALDTKAMVDIVDALRELVN